MTIRSLAALLLGLGLTAPGLGGEKLTKKVLIIGIDGCRTDALLAAKAPNLHALIRDGAFADKTQVLAPRPAGIADTVSGPGWSDILTGVWPDKHGVRDNRFKDPHFKEYPHFFARLKAARPSAYTASYVTWPSIHRYIVSAANDSRAMLQSKKSDPAGDEQGTRKVCELLRHGNPDAVFLHLDNVDEAGHHKGFSPEVPEYLRAIEEVDGRVGRILEVLRGRKTYATEDWLIIVCTDHGGKGRGHGGGREVPAIREVFLIVSGPAATRGKIAGPTYLVDVAATALTHLGVRLDPAWKLDGRPVGLRSAR